MNRSCPVRTDHRGAVAPPFALLLAVVLAALAPRADAVSIKPYGTAPTARELYCQMTAINGQFKPAESLYSASGDCVGLDSPIPQGRGVSEFPDTNVAITQYQVSWTAQAGYNPSTQLAWEKIVLAPPPSGQPIPPGRPQGSYEAMMNCSADPWLAGSSASCGAKRMNLPGELGDYGPALRNSNGPVTMPRKPAQLQALNAAHDHYVTTHTFMSTAESASKGSVIATIFAPTVIEPKPGSTHRPQVPMSICVAAAQNAKDTAYDLEIQVRVNFDWRVVTHIPVAAAVAQSRAGYRGWGGLVDGTGPEMTASVGVYRVRATPTAPSRSAPSDWVEFKVEGPTGITILDAARSTVDQPGGASTVMKAAGLAGAAQAPHTKAHAVAVLPAPAPLVPASPLTSQQERSRVAHSAAATTSCAPEAAAAGAQRAPLSRR
jgi:hypothetical protein